MKRVQLLAIASSIPLLVWLETVATIAQSPAFEVASVRPTSPRMPLSRLTDSRVDLVLPLRSVLLEAFRLKDYQLSAPDWLREGSDAWVEIRASMTPGATVQQVPEMLRRLLIERFGLVVHTETRMVSGYHLVLGPGGMKMREVEPLNELEKEFEVQVASTGPPMADRVTQTPDGVVRTITIRGGMRRITTRTMYERTVASDGSGIASINAIRMTTAELTTLLAANLDELDVDKTGLTGVYQFKIELPRDATTLRLAGAAGMKLEVPLGVSSAFKAVETLGLKLERGPTAVEVVVVDKMNRTPTEN